MLAVQASDASPESGTDEPDIWLLSEVMMAGQPISLASKGCGTAQVAAGVFCMTSATYSNRSALLSAMFIFLFKMDFN